jgi:hypothetical protein
MLRISGALPSRCGEGQLYFYVTVFLGSSLRSITGYRRKDRRRDRSERKMRKKRRRKLLDYLKERRGYSHMKEEALDRTMWRARFGRGFGPVMRTNTK